LDPIGGIMRIFQVYSLDVWGNKIDGFEINNIFDTGLFIESEEFPSFDNIIKILKKSEFLKKRYHFTSQYTYDEFEVVEYNGEPVYQIQEYSGSINGQYFTNFPYKRNAIVYRICPKMIKQVYK